MKRIFYTFAIVILVLTTYAGELQNKASELALQYQAVMNLNSAQTQNAEDLLLSYFTNKHNGIPISAATQNQVNGIMNTIKSSSSGALTATTPLFSISGSLDVSDPTFNRVFGTTFNLGCITQGSLSTSGNNVYYDVYEFTVTDAGDFDIEVTSFPEDSYLALYCSFDPMAPQDNCIYTNDDGGDGFLSQFSDITLPTGTYYLVMHSFGNAETGNYTIEFRSDNGNAVLGTAVPLNYWWIFGLFVLIGIGIILKRFF